MSRSAEYDRVADHAVVVRGGSQRHPQVLLNTVIDTLDETGTAVLSVHALPPTSAEPREQTVFRISTQARIPHGQIQYGIAADIRAAGFEIVEDRSGDQAATHCHVIFNSPVRRWDMERLLNQFHGPFPNPTKSTHHERR